MRALLLLALSGCGLLPFGKDEPVDTSSGQNGAENGGNGADTEDPDADLDSDGFPGSADCDDHDPNVNPDAQEVCGGGDEDCDGKVDDADDSTDIAGMSTAFPDADGDGYGSNDERAEYCAAPKGWLTSAGDCDDSNASVSPAGTEACNDIDDDCDGDIDEPGAEGETVSHRDSDGDGYGDAASSRSDCAVPADYVLDASDCDDRDPGVHPSAPETCDDEDDDCDGATDEDATDATTYYRDADRDGYGDASDSVVQCDPAAGLSTNHSDCDDTSAAVHPGATEVCDDRDTDEDCNGAADDAAASTSTMSAFYLDADGDGYGSGTSVVYACDAPDGYGVSSSDCNDADATVSPGAREVCDAADRDEDCDGRSDDADSSVDRTDGTTYYVDNDADGWGSSYTSVRCDLTSGYSVVTGDCDDRASNISPDGVETCDDYTFDEDCDGLVDDADDAPAALNTWYEDADRDGYGDETVTLAQCDAPAGYVAISGDCDTGDGAVHPGAAEVCGDAVDDDCDGSIACDVDTDDARASWLASSREEIPTAVTHLPDYDGDGIDDLLLSLEYEAGGYGGALVVSGTSTGTTALPTTGLLHVMGTSTTSGVKSGGAGDFDGDGLIDLAVGSGNDSGGGSSAGAVYVYVGGESGTVTAADAWASVQGASSVRLGRRIDVGDLDADGLPEVVTTSNYGDGGKNFILHDIAAGTQSYRTMSWEVTGPRDWDVHSANLGFYGSPIADLNGDGFNDLVTGCPTCDVDRVSYSGAAFVDYGPITGPLNVTASDLTVFGTETSTALGSGLSADGDLNGDGVVDLILSNDSAAPSLYVLSLPGSGYGPPTDFATATVEGASGWSTAGADVDGDGTADLAFTSSTEALVGVLAGGPGFVGTLSAADAPLRIFGTSDYYFTNGVSWAHDVDGDGGDELAFCAFNIRFDGGAAWLLDF